MIVERHGGEVPRTLAAITELPGVARKTGNVVLGMGYGLSTGIVVDTHVRRVSRRLELTVEDKPEKVEAELQGLFSKRTWVDIGHRLVLHGRYVCQAKKPRCERCPLHETCGAATGSPEVRSWTRRAEWEQRLVSSKGKVDTL